ncbi:MAG: YitT family protein [Pilosibacter sp.]
MFGLGWLELGKKFAATTLLATFYYPFILDRLTALAGDFVFTTDPMLCAIFAGSDDRIRSGDRDPLRCLHRRHGHPSACPAETL